MKTLPLLAALSAVTAACFQTQAASTGPRFYGDPPDDHHPWAVHDANRPEPKRVTPGTFSSVEKPGKPPSDAIVLFDGTDLSKWQNDKGETPKWTVQDGFMQVMPGSGQIRTRDEFGDIQLHIEWAAPAKVEGSSQGRGNSGVFFMGRLEIQVLDCYNNPTYADGSTGGYYGVNPPLALAVQPPGVFQVYDIVFRRPIYKDGKAIDPGHVTVFLNGVLVQDATPIEGPGGHMGRSKPGPFPEKGPLSLQDHGNPMRFRNIWYRELPPRSSQGGTDGYLSTEATLAKRHETADMIRKDAATLKNDANPLPELLRQLESLVYEKDDATQQRAETLAKAYFAKVKALSGADLAAKKDEVKSLRDTYKYLVRFKIVPDTFPTKSDVEQLIKDQAWDKK